MNRKSLAILSIIALVVIAWFVPNCQADHVRSRTVVYGRSFAAGCAGSFSAKASCAGRSVGREVNVFRGKVKKPCRGRSCPTN